MFCKPTVHQLVYILLLAINTLSLVGGSARLPTQKWTVLYYRDTTIVDRTLNVGDSSYSSSTTVINRGTPRRSWAESFSGTWLIRPSSSSSMFSWIFRTTSASRSNSSWYSSFRINNEDLPRAELDDSRFRPRELGAEAFLL